MTVIADPPPEPLPKVIVQSVEVCVGSSMQEMPSATRVAVAAAPEPPPPENTNVGAVVHPAPCVTTTTPFTAPPEMVVEPVGNVVHDPPENATEGAPLYPEPPAVIVTAVEIDPETPAMKLSMGSCGTVDPPTAMVWL